jgi:sigma-E factor negative regulatory protein RseB
MPPGFRMIGAPSAASAARAHLLFSDGMAYVSVYIEPLASSGRPMDGAVKRGAMNLYARPVDNNQVVVIGDVPAATAEKIARSVEPRR